MTCVQHLPAVSGFPNEEMNGPAQTLHWTGASRLQTLRLGSVGILRHNSLLPWRSRRRLHPPSNLVLFGLHQGALFNNILRCYSDVQYVLSTQSPKDRQQSR